MCARARVCAFVPWGLYHRGGGAQLLFPTGSLAPTASCTLSTAGAPSSAPEPLILSSADPTRAQAASVRSRGLTHLCISRARPIVISQ